MATKKFIAGVILAFECDDDFAEPEGVVSAILTENLKHDGTIIDWTYVKKNTIIKMPEGYVDFELAQRIRSEYRGAVPVEYTERREPDENELFELAEDQGILYPKEDNVDRLARAFSIVLESWLSPNKMQFVIDKNRLDPDPGVCHSHDFCDANMAMDAAFRIVIGRRQENGDLTIWNNAWTLAKKNNFYYAQES